MTDNKPIHEVRLGRIRATLWQNAGEENGTTWINTTFSKLYKAEDGWRDVASFGRDDLPILAKVADLVHSWIYERATGQDPAEKPEAAEKGE